MHIGQLRQSTSRRKGLSLMTVWVWQRKRSSRLEFQSRTCFQLLNSRSKSIYGLISMPNTWTRGKSLSISQIGKTGLQTFVFFSHIQRWLTDLVTAQTTPQQENGYDCGVFTCQFLETISRGEESFRFSQKNMPYLRRRMIWEIGNATLRDDHY